MTTPSRAKAQPRIAGIAKFIGPLSLERRVRVNWQAGSVASGPAPGGFPWDAEQAHESFPRHLIDEVGERLRLAIQFSSRNFSA